MNRKSAHKRRKKSRVVHVLALKMNRSCGCNLKNDYGMKANLGKTSLRFLATEGVYMFRRRNFCEVGDHVAKSGMLVV
jgi:hypothetical protein